MVSIRTKSVVAAGLILGAFAAGFVVAQRLSPEPGPPLVFDEALTASMRTAAQMVPGPLPLSVHAIVLTRFTRPGSSVAEGASDDPTHAIRAAFQVRYSDEWLMVDAGLDSAFDPRGLTPTAADYAILQEGLHGARMIVITHAHLDHVAGIIRSPHRDDLEESVLFTREQVDILVRQDTASLIRLDAAEAERFVAVDYDPVMPVAPGVVLVDAPGHTRDSQFVYVRLASGDEFLFAGDVSNLHTALSTGQHKPRRPDIAEDRNAIEMEMAWLRNLMDAGVHVVLSHDGADLDALIAAGVIQSELDLSEGS